ncbi:hypothetical protein [Peribacillus asahii]|uniref:hypothetical protein n=1 Tax=Peribacillus asahii TaxID=228899 RepID=UPI00382BC42A
MITLTEEQYQLIQQYTELVRTVNEAFTYVVTSFDDLSYTEGDTVLSDIFTALQQLSGANSQLTILFKDLDAVNESIMQFSQVVEGVDKLDSVWGNVEARQQFIRETLAPAYTSWSERVLHILQPYAVA